MLVVTCTGGERGEVLNPKLADDPQIAANLSEVRSREMDRAREILGVRRSGWGSSTLAISRTTPLDDRDHCRTGALPASRSTRQLRHSWR